MHAAYRKHNSCHDAIFATQEAILKKCGDTFLSLFNLEKAYESLVNTLFSLIDSLFDAGIKGRD